jgi:DNA-binding transcriptional LysR family regulator
MEVQQAEPGDVTMQQLEYVVALARERHFGRAAKACHVSQPTLSAAIRRLEYEVDAVVVLRGRRFEGFTAEGERVVTWARRILAERDELFSDIARVRGGLTATARLGAIPTAVPATPLVTRRFLEGNPGAKVRIEALSSREIARRLADFDLDAGLTYLDHETPPGTRRVGLYRERYSLVAPAEHLLMSQSEVSWSDAAKLPLCALTNRHAQPPHHRSERGGHWRPTCPRRGGEYDCGAVRASREPEACEHRCTYLASGIRGAHGPRRSPDGAARARPVGRANRVGPGAQLNHRRSPIEGGVRPVDFGDVVALTYPLDPRPDMPLPDPANGTHVANGFLFPGPTPAVNRPISPGTRYLSSRVSLST